MSANDPLRRSAPAFRVYNFAAILARFARPKGLTGVSRKSEIRIDLDEGATSVYRCTRGNAPLCMHVLRRLLRHTGRLTGSVAGSVSLIDADHGCYVKAAEYGASCQLGRSFPLDEGATGRAFGSRRPVVIPDYARLRAGHLAAAHPARHGPAAAVPIWWRGDVIAVSVAFAPAAGIGMSCCVAGAFVVLA